VFYIICVTGNQFHQNRAVLARFTFTWFTRWRRRRSLNCILIPVYHNECISFSASSWNFMKKAENLPSYLAYNFFKMAAAILDLSLHFRFQIWKSQTCHQQLCFKFGWNRSSHSRAIVIHVITRLRPSWIWEFCFHFWCFWVRATAVNVHLKFVQIRWKMTVSKFLIFFPNGLHKNRIMISYCILDYQFQWFVEFRNDISLFGWIITFCLIFSFG
jgi:hypothetical protein